ncbi:MAG: hypothetical protein V7640_1077, partial [Betaproteobacteria bacterium]
MQRAVTRHTNPLLTHSFRRHRLAASVFAACAMLTASPRSNAGAEFSLGDN